MDVFLRLFSDFCGACVCTACSWTQVGRNIYALPSFVAPDLVQPMFYLGCRSPTLSVAATAVLTFAASATRHVSARFILLSSRKRFDTLAVLLLIPIADGVVYPWMRKMGCEPTMLRKIGAGLLFAGAALLVASAVEVSRRNGVVYGDGAVLSPCRRCVCVCACVHKRETERGRGSSGDVSFLFYWGCVRRRKMGRQI